MGGLAAQIPNQLGARDGSGHQPQPFVFLLSAPHLAEDLIGVLGDVAGGAAGLLLERALGTALDHGDSMARDAKEGRVANGLRVIADSQLTSPVPDGSMGPRFRRSATTDSFPHLVVSRLHE